ncbi:hypothetical protein LKR43_00020 [Pusillimonas sp. MFBS29]|uniref:hypothetical protein n=1 Tax=Pusillimonas sp. MFBS29 TaxID=2886690 RepID=UPI001D0F7D13|nr:hypothetical protein [Pusillimonas sp. MFBS29]MCC2594722.1 hypothetical protein [Pusillimonas sp. MFBS29]
MARLLPNDFRSEKLSIAEACPNYTEVLYLPSLDELKEAEISASTKGKSHYLAAKMMPVFETLPSPISLCGLSLQLSCT